MALTGYTSTRRDRCLEPSPRGVPYRRWANARCLIHPAQWHKAQKVKAGSWGGNPIRCGSVAVPMSTESTSAPAARLSDERRCRHGSARVDPGTVTNRLDAHPL